MKKFVLLFCTLSFLLFQSSNGQWQQVHSPGGNVTCFAYFGSDILAGIAYSGVFRSSDNGMTWTNITNNLPSPNISCLVVSGQNIFAGIFIPGLFQSARGIFLSNDGGSHWTSINNNLTDTLVTSIAAWEPNIFAGTYTRGVFLSGDTGRSWRSLNTDIKSVLYNSDITCFVHNETCIWAGTNGYGVLLSQDTGVTWNVSGWFPEGPARDVFALGINKTNVFAGTSGFGTDGIFRNSARYWETSSTGMPPVPFIDAITVYDTDVFAGSIINGIFYWANNGNNWSAINDGLVNLQISSLITNGTDVFAGANDGRIY